MLMQILIFLFQMTVEVNAITPFASFCELLNTIWLHSVVQLQ